jgi:hypothetical protein
LVVVTAREYRAMAAVLPVEFDDAPDGESTPEMMSNTPRDAESARRKRVDMNATFHLRE